jgi:hypothetical protein
MEPAERQGTYPNGYCGSSPFLWRIFRVRHRQVERARRFYGNVQTRKTVESLATTLCNEDTDMMLDWNAYRRQLALGVKEILSVPCSSVGTPSFIWTR